MKLTVLGTSAGFAGKNDACSSYLVTLEEKQYLIDVGPGSLSSLQNHIGFRELDAILISHLHADHVSDLYTLRFAVSIAQNEGSMPHPFPIYMPRHPAETFSFIESNIREEFRIGELDEPRVLDLEGMEVRFLRTRHPVLAHAMRFVYRGKVLVYTTDTAYFDELVTFCSGAHLLLAEATLQDKEQELEETGHMTARTAGLLAERAGADRLVITHIWPEYDRKISLAEAHASYPGKIDLAERGLELTI